jgi:hypothetical protein
VTIGFTYDDTDRLGRIRIDLSGYSALADFAIVERSSDQVNWSIIRGGDEVALSGGAGSIDDYEFTANAANYYRVNAWNNGGGHFVSAGTAGSADNSSIGSGQGLGLPAGLAAGDRMILFAANRDFSATPQAPAGWTSLMSVANIQLFKRTATASESIPTVTFTGSGAGDTCQAQIAAWRYIEADPVAATDSFANQQNIPIPGADPIQPDGTRMTVVHTGWKNTFCTSVNALAGYTMIPVTSSTAGDDQMIVWATKNFTGTVDTTEFSVIGGSTPGQSARGETLVFRGVATNTETASYTPAVTRYRIKSPTRPSLNTFIEPLEDRLEITRPARTGLFDVLSRSMPVAVTDLQGSRRFTLRLDVKGDSLRADMDNRLSTGAVYFLQPPDPGGAVPTLYFVLGDVVNRMDTEYLSDSYTFTLDVIEVAKPPFTVYGNTSTWTDIVSDFATWADLIAAEPTWADVVDRVSDTDVIVP